MTTIGVVALVALALAGAATYTAFSQSQLRQVDDSLERAHEPIEELVAADPPDLELQIQQAAPGTFVALRNSDGTTQLVIPVREPGHEPAAIALDSISDLAWSPPQPGGDPEPAKFRTARVTSGDDELRLRISLLDDGSELFIGQTLHEISKSQTRLLLIQFVVAAAALTVAIAGGWLLVRAGLKPLRRVEQTALSIAEGGRLPSSSSHFGKAAIVSSVVMVREGAPSTSFGVSDQ